MYYFIKIIYTTILLGFSFCIYAQTDSTKHYNWDIIPLISVSPEVGLLLGVNPIFNFKTTPEDTLLRSSFLSPQVFGTFREQYGIQIPGNLFFKQNDYSLDLMISGVNSEWRYYGTGNNVDLDKYDRYRFRALSIDVALLRKVMKNVYAGAGYRFNHQDIFTPPEGGILETDRPVGYRGFTASAPALLLRWESRDNILNAYRGTFLNLRGELHRNATGSTHSFEVLSLDFRHYIPLSKRPYHVLAFQLLHQATFGRVPFAELGMQGGSVIQRGYFSGVYRDRYSVAFQMEYRQMLGKKLGVVLFASTGNVMPAYDQLDLGETTFAAGIGLRFALISQNRINLRYDHAFGNNSQGQYFGIGEAF